MATPATESSGASTLAAPLSFTIHDLALLHHWTVCTSVELFEAENVNKIWQVVFPQIGFQHPFVARIILSLAALHLADIHGTKSKSYLLQAAHHHNEALQGFQVAIRNINSDNSEALMVWSILNLLYVFGVSKPRGEEQNSATYDKDRMLGMEWIPMMRGVQAVLTPVFGVLRFGRLRSLMDVDNWMELDPDQATSLSRPGDVHLCQTRQSWKNSANADTYEEALHSLRKCHMFIEQFKTMDEATLAGWGQNRKWSGPFIFINFAPEEYFTLLHQRQPPALILYAYFGALLHEVGEFWFLKGWGKGIIYVVDELLGNYWRPSIIWPLQVAGLA